VLTLLRSSSGADYRETRKKEKSRSRGGPGEGTALHLDEEKGSKGNSCVSSLKKGKNVLS